MRRCRKTHCRRKQYWLVVHLVILLAGTSLELLIVSWKIGLMGVRVGESTVPGLVIFGRSNHPAKHIQCVHCGTWMSSSSVLWRHWKRFHEVLGGIIPEQSPDVVDMVSDDHVMEQECPSESDIEEALPSASHTAAQTKSNEEKHNFFVTRGGRRALLREAHSGVSTCTPQHTELATTSRIAVAEVA